jgi:hypothetical protein
MKALSIHLGLNQVDPAHYGSAARLAGCHNDANDLCQLATSTGFTTAAILLDGQATVANLKTALGNAAAELQAGDSLLLTYSGHGSQIEDTSPDCDEIDHADETWCLYDRMIIDDELAALWAKFRRGVRITVLSDSCHSGTVTRELSWSPPGSIRSGRKNRLLPDECRRRAITNWGGEYARIQRELARKTIVINAAVILISGCQDNETSRDGNTNGLFTGTLLKVWKNGKFAGTLKQLQTEIRRRITQSQNPNYFVIGAIDTAFASAPALRPAQV